MSQPKTPFEIFADLEADLDRAAVHIKEHASGQDLDLEGDAIRRMTGLLLRCTTKAGALERYCASHLEQLVTHREKVDPLRAEELRAHVEAIDFPEPAPTPPKLEKILN